MVFFFRYRVHSICKKKRDIVISLIIFKIIFRFNFVVFCRSLEGRVTRVKKSEFLSRQFFWIPSLYLMHRADERKFLIFLDENSIFLSSLLFHERRKERLQRFFFSILVEFCSCLRFKASTQTIQIFNLKNDPEKKNWKIETSIFTVKIWIRLSSAHKTFF